MRPPRNLLSKLHHTIDSYQHNHYRHHLQSLQYHSLINHIVYQGSVLSNHTPGIGRPTYARSVQSKSPSRGCE